MPEAERTGLAQEVLPFALKGELHVRQAAIEALERIASPVATRDLQSLESDGAVEPDVCQMLEDKPDECGPVYAYRDGAQRALQRIRELEEAVRRCREE